jgi:hypothetical protein
MAQVNIRTKVQIVRKTVTMSDDGLSYEFKFGAGNETTVPEDLVQAVL